MDVLMLLIMLALVIGLFAFIDILARLEGK